MYNRVMLTQKASTPHSGFDALGVAPNLIEVLDRMKFHTPTPIQHQAIPIAIEGKDVLGIAQTGTGKTAAYGIPMVQRLAQKKGRGLICVPTRELAIQVDEVFQKLGRAFNLRSVVLIGGSSMFNQIQNLRKHPKIIIATPGRLIDHLRQKNVTLSDVEILVLDEADRMLDMGFQPQIEQILKYVPKDRQTMLFSATMPQEIIKMTRLHMKIPVSVEIAPSGTAAQKVTQEVYIVNQESKKNLLQKLLEQYHGTVLIFSRTKNGTRKVTKMIRSMGQNAAEIHSDRTLAQRREALEGFKSGKYRILVATDIAARGIDVVGIQLVINYDLPDDSENYVHRIGRTGRAGHEGHAISFAMPDQSSEIKSIERIIRTSLPISAHPDMPAESFHQAAAKFTMRFAPGRGRRLIRHRKHFR